MNAWSMSKLIPSRVLCLTVCVFVCVCLCVRARVRASVFSFCLVALQWGDHTPHLNKMKDAQNLLISKV